MFNLTCLKINQNIIVVIVNKRLNYVYCNSINIVIYYGLCIITTNDSMIL